MTVREMQMAFDTRIQLVSEAEVIKTKPDSFTILQFLNRAQEKYVTENYLSKGSFQENIQFIQRRSDVLRNLIKRTPVSGVGSLVLIDNGAGNLPDGGIPVTLPDDYLYYIKSFSKIENVLARTADFEWSPSRVVNHDELDRITNGAFHRPILREPCIIFEENNNAIYYKDIDTTLFTGTVDVTPNFYMIYLRQPKELVLTVPSGSTDYITDECELDDFVHNDVVELAVQMYIVDYKYRLGSSGQPQQPQQTNG